MESEVLQELHLDTSIVTSLRLFTQSPYPEFDYIITPVDYKYCANQSLFSFAKGFNYKFSWIDITPAMALDFVYVQTCILIFNNPNNTDSTQFLTTLDKIFKWGTEDPYEKIAYETVAEVVEAVLWADNYLEILEDKGYDYVIYDKSLWYADHIMKPSRFQDETWKEYSNRIRRLKAEARGSYKNLEARARIMDKSRELKSNDLGIAPTPQTLNTVTKYDIRIIKEVTEKGVVWQDKTMYNKMKYLKLKSLYPNYTQEELSEMMNISLRTLQRTIKELK
ncbi:hypothetical protein [Tenacibaculum sp.]|uniref:hypothetical protein n=1 Tax=Tenacibaculum sp. TaxID=1906242 RepID=UPI003D0A52EC